ncbi:MAG: plasmid pRiA4b ORF-3 family protein, partial [bacterium]|nr:plasmid pRiA4b ORF-3 family protein [Candidatus Colisoma equi]
VELPPTGIVRTISVPECMTLEDLHEAIQAVMGWGHEHLWHFVTGGRDGVIYEVPHEDDFAAFGRRLRMDATKTALRKVFPKRGAKLTYEYDFGDSWDHVITRLADPKEPEIACLKSEGPDGLEDFGGQWRYAESLKALRENPDSGKDDECEIAGWVGLDTPEDVERYLAGESAEVKTRKLKKALSHVKVVIPPKAEKAPKMSDEEQAHMLGVLFATTVSRGMWEIIEDALKNGGKCEFIDDEKSIGSWLLDFFDGLKVKDGVATPFCTNPSKLTVHKKWVDWYAAHHEEWSVLRGQMDILESYANSTVHLYGAVTWTELYDIMRRYDPGILLEQNEVERYLSARALCPQMAYRVDGDRIVDAVAFAPEREDSDRAVDETLKAQKEWPRWYPATRDELFSFETMEVRDRTPEVERVELVLRTTCKLTDDQVEQVIDAAYGLLVGAVPPEAIYKSMVMANLVEKLSTKPRQNLIDALSAWSETLHAQCLNGNTVQDLRAREAAKASAQSSGPK